jgi:cation-transporting P-type ATPase C
VTRSEACSPRASERQTLFIVDDCPWIRLTARSQVMAGFTTVRCGGARLFPFQHHLHGVAMSKSTALRIALGADGVSIWSSEIFGGAEASRVRDFLSRAFAVPEVDGVELRRAKSFGRIRYAALGNPARVWKKLSRALSSPDDAPLAGDSPARRVDAGLLYLEGPSATRVRISRIGNVLSTWRVRHQSHGTLGLWHPLLRNRRDVVFRLEEELAAMLGVEDFRASAVTGNVSIRFDGSMTTAERLARELEKAWPRLLTGLDGPPSQKRLVAAVGLVGLAFTGQYLAPVVRPFAVAGVTLYSSPNVLKAMQQLTRGEVGVSALYTTGLAFMLVSGLPFTASVMAALMQFWPHLAHRKLVRSQRRLFAGQRRRPAWARIVQADGVEVEVNIEDLRRDDRIVVRRGESLPADGVVEDGFAAVVDDLQFGGRQSEDRSPGDAVAAGAFVRDGSLTIRVERAGADSSASYLASLLPHGVPQSAFGALPSSLEVERIANRNAKPALALSAFTFSLTRSLLPAQALIRPDYVTAPRISVQLSALQAVADGLQRGVWFRNPAALDRVGSSEVYIIDETAGLDRRQIEVAAVQTADGVSAEAIVGHALAAQRKSRAERSRALQAFASKRNVAPPRPESVRRFAGVIRYADDLGSQIEIATPSYLGASKIAVPPRFQNDRGWRNGASGTEPATQHDPSLRPLYVLRDGDVIGVVAFARTGEMVGRQAAAALAAHNERARVVYLSSAGEGEAKALARKFGIGSVHAGLSPSAKVELIRGLGRDTLWIGDGTDADAKKAIAASAVSVSVAPLSRSREDAADILLPHQRLSAIAEVIDLGRAHAKRLEKDYRTVYALNLLGAAGALLAGLNGLQVGLLSNVGTGLIYSRHARYLDLLASDTEEKRARLTHVPAR